MIKFQDVLLQKGLVSGPSWCREGINCIAKGLQLLTPNIFGNIFVGVGFSNLKKL